MAAQAVRLAKEISFPGQESQQKAASSMSSPKYASESASGSGSLLTILE
jgi:hypothetical protein